MPDQTISEADEDARRFAPKCVWCSAPWSDDNISVLNVSSSGGCDTCGYGASVWGEIDISCHECGKLMYRKEFSE